MARYIPIEERRQYVAAAESFMTENRALVGLHLNIYLNLITDNPEAMLNNLFPEQPDIFIPELDRFLILAHPAHSTDQQTVQMRLHDGYLATLTPIEERHIGRAEDFLTDLMRMSGLLRTYPTFVPSIVIAETQEVLEYMTRLSPPAVR